LDPREYGGIKIKHSVLRSAAKGCVNASRSAPRIRTADGLCAIRPWGNLAITDTELT